MRNRIDRYNQRSYKYWEQERIPEYFLDEDPYDFLDWTDWYNSLHNDSYSGSLKIVCSDCESVDSYFVKRKKKDTKQSKNNKKSLASLAAPKNLYAALDMEESYTILGEDNEQQQGKYLDSGEEEAEATILNSSCKEETEVDESKKCLKETVTDDETDLEEKRQKWVERQEWVDSWSKNEDGYQNWWVITVDGFFRKKRKAGYGVMIRDRYGVPILASASVYDLGKPVSYIYHTLQGIDRGLQLALKYGIYKVDLFYTLPRAVDQLIQSFLKSKSSRYDSDDGYSSSDSEYNYSRLINNCEGKDEFQLVSALFRDIVQKCRMFVADSSMRNYMSDSPMLKCSNTKRRYNIPADYLAKLQVTKKEMKPEEFSEELKEILYADTHNWEMMDFILVNQQRYFIIHPKRMDI